MDTDKDKVPIEEAINRAGFGLYSFLLLILSGLVVISMACIAYGGMIIIPTSACELETTTAQKGILAAAPVVGLVIGGVVWGYLADVYGRRLTLIISLLSAATVNALVSISVNWVMLMILQFIASVLSSGLNSLSMTMLSESVPMAKRNLVVLLVGSIILMSQGIMAVLAIPIIPLSFSYELPALGIYWNSWRTIIVVYSIPSLLSALGLYLMNESPKYVFSKGREEEALKILKSIYKINNLCSKAEFGVKGLLKETVTTDSTSDNRFMSLFKAPLLKTTIILTLLFLFQQIGSFLIWLPTIANEFISILDSGDNSGQTFCAILKTSMSAPIEDEAVPCSLNVTSLLIVLAVGAMQSIVNAIISLVVNYTGRRTVVMVVSAICGVCGIIVNLIPNAIGSAAMFFIFLIGIVNLMLYTAMGVASYPTYLRALAVAFLLTANRVGTFASVQILNVLLESNCEVGFYVYSALFASSAVIVAFLADDRIRQKEVTDTKL